MYLGFLMPGGWYALFPWQPFSPENPARQVLGALTATVTFRPTFRETLGQVEVDQGTLHWKYTRKGDTATKFPILPQITQIFSPDFKCNKRNGQFFGPNRVVFWGSYSVFACPLSSSDSRFEIKNGSLGPRTFHFKASWLKALCEIGSLAISHQRMVFSECELVGNSTKIH